MSDKRQRTAFRPRGGYRALRSFQVSERIYDATVWFCDRFIDRRSRTHDQMVQAARSGRPNIAEGSRASATSAKSEMMLVNVARASLDELLLDYEGFLRQRGLAFWDKDDAPARTVRLLGHHRTDPTDPYAPWLHHGDPAVVANTVICLIHQANYLLDRQWVGLERQFAESGGFGERLGIRRREELARSDRSDRSVERGPACPLCGGEMLLRVARRGARAGSRFWGCRQYPDCLGTRTVRE